MNKFADETRYLMCFDGFGKNNDKKIREIMKQIHAILQLIRWVYLQSFGEFPALNLKALLYE